jgi:hypothetical protein
MMGIIISIIGFYVVVVIVFIIQFYLAKRDITNNLPKYIDARKPPQGCYQPIRDTCGKYPPGYRLNNKEITLCLNASFYTSNKENKIILENNEIAIKISRKISINGIEIEINDQKLWIDKEQLNELIKFIS